MWWFSKSAPDQKRVILCLSDKSAHNGRVLHIVKLLALSGDYIQVHFEDGSTSELAVADFNAEEGGFTHDLRADMSSEQFVQQFAELFAKFLPPQGHLRRNLIAGAVGGAVAVAAVPVVLPLVGFGAVGITSGSYAASMMSASAIANGGGVAAGGVVATLQAVGASGLGAVGGAAVASTGAAVGATLSYLSSWYGTGSNA